MMGKTRIEELCYELYGSSKQHDSWHRYAMVRELRDLMKRSSESDHFDRSGNDRMSGEIHEGLVHKAILEEKSTSQFQVSIAHSEIVRSISSGKVDLGLENEESVELNENLEQEGDQKNAKKKTDVDGEVERDQKLISDANTCCAHKVFDQMPLRIASKEKRRKSLKAWKFKFKITSKRSKSMDVKFFSVEEIAGIRKDSKEANWGCVNKEFKEVVAGCGKTRDDQFKLVDMSELRSEVLDQIVTLMYHQIGHGIDTLLICDCSNISSRANRVWKPGGLLCVQGHSGGSMLMRTQRVQGLHLQGILNMDMKFQEVIMVNVETGSKEHSHESFGSKGFAYDGCVIVGMNFAGFERGEAELLATSQKMQRINLFSFCCSCTNQIFVAIHTEIEGNLEFNQLLATKEGFSREVKEELAKRIVIEQKIEGGLICGDVKFHLKHKWRFRLFQSISRLELLALIDLWLSKTHAFSGQLQDLRRASVFERRKKKLCYKTWMFKYKVDEEDQGILQLRTGWVQEVSAVIRFRRRGHLHLYLDCEEPELAGRKRNHGLVIRMLNKLKQQRCPKSWMFKFKTDSKSARTNHILLQEKKPNKFEQVMNHTPFYVAKFGKYKDCDALLLLRPSNGRFQIKHRELLVIVLEWVDTKGGFGMDKKPLHLSLRNRVWDPGGCLENLEVKVSSRREICYRLLDMGWFGSRPIFSLTAHEVNKTKNKRRAEASHYDHRKSIVTLSSRNSFFARFLS